MNQYIRMISEGSCYTEDWSNDAEIQLTYYLLTANCIFDQINAVLVNKRLQ